MLEEDIIKLYTEQKLGAPAISKLLNTTNNKVYKTLKQNNIPPRSHREKGKKSTANDNFFNQINTEEKAYWLGFLYADGYITKDGKIGCTLATKDEEHLKKFQTDIETNYPIRTYTQTKGYAPGTLYVRIQICSQQLIQDAIKHGLVPNKTKILTFPATIPQDLLRHFLRGYIDGDGSWKIDKRAHCGYSLAICGTKEFLDNAAPHLGLSPNKVYRHKNVFSLETTGNDTLRVMHLVYKDAKVFLERKYERYLHAQSLISEMDIRKITRIAGNSLESRVPIE